MRNMEKAAKDGQKLCTTRKGLDLSQNDMIALLNIYEGNGGKDPGAALYATCSAYYAGLAVGYRNAARKEARA